MQQKIVMRKIHVWHDRSGRIIAWGHVPAGLPITLQAASLAGPNHDVIEVEAPEHALPTLHETHYVPLSSKALATRDRS